MIEIAICDDDSVDLKLAVSMLEEILTGRNIVYHIKSFLSSIEMLENVQGIDIGILDIAMNGA